jgi:hypothetical protein
MNLTALLGARKDRHARKLGDLTLGQKFVRIGDAREVWSFVRACGGRMFRVLYLCKDGKVRDIIGRQGVHDSRQDGMVENVGHAMASAERLTLSFWTDTSGGKVNTGAGKGYRTLRAAGILALRIDGTDIVTDAGERALALVSE